MTGRRAGRYSRHRKIDPEKQALVEQEENTAFVYQVNYFKGTARVSLTDIAIGNNVNRLIDGHENVARLKEIMRIEGCFRLKKSCHVPVAISSADWDSQRVWFDQTAELQADAPFSSFPRLCKCADYTLLALDRESLITAAKEIFQEIGVQDPWWIVDVYVVSPGKTAPIHQRRDYSPALNASDQSELTGRQDHGADRDDAFFRPLRESYQKERAPSDGRIYQSIRYYQKRQNGPAERFWWAVLQREPASRKGDYLRTLPSVLAEAFDALLPIPGLWAGMNIGVLHKLKAMKCYEAITCYLRLIGDVFTNMAGGRQELMSRFDASTVDILQSRAPGVSTWDWRFLQENQGKLFCFVEDPGDRHQIWERLRTIRSPIPTLKTFFQDILYLEIGQVIIQQICLTPPNTEVTIDQTLKHQHDGVQGQLALEQAPPLLDGLSTEAHLWDLWRFSLQFGFEMSKRRDHCRRLLRKREDIDRLAQVGRENDPSEELSTALWCHLFWLAQSHGFNIPPNHEPVMLNHEILNPAFIDLPLDDTQDINIERRCGRPFIDAAKPDRYALSLEALLDTRSSSRVSSVSVRQSVFRAFFSYLGVAMVTGPAEFSSDPFVEQHFSGDENNVTFHLTPSISSSTGQSFGDTFDDIPIIVTPPPILPPSQTDSQTYIAPMPLYHFQFEVLVLQHLSSIWLPNNRNVLNSFFENLQKFGFHIYHSNDLSRAIYWSDCYSLYIDNPRLKLRAVYCEGCFEHPWNYLDHHDEQAVLLEPSIVQVTTWLSEEIIKMRNIVADPF
ncbi:hypothetical protein N7478_000742 [Penicillium angulare]|uniref:uncharacterized protein n=1 Tax=Penicillium angulare TaxID=116970 RepID=UPI00253FFB18|nr:uncharacterized protein N7478_000742 [Penicillium angulare]KAJ5291491.1 hypothetical protein N7478_000742 [Penicillium angulare]